VNDFLTRLYVRFTESRGQTMAEYALIMAAIAVICYAAYQTLGGAITTKAGEVSTALGG
jgi:Flp pilus assembly pilin Flp